VRDDLVPGVIKGINASRENGVLAGYPLIDFKATLLDGAYHDFDSSAHTFEIAARAAFRLLKNEDAVRLLEPIMAVEISGLQQLRDTFIDDLKARRGVMQDDDIVVVRALVPLAAMLGYRHVFATLSRGYGRFTMRYSHHQVTSFGDDDPDPFRPAMAMRLRA
jgi:elongation factor G